MSAAGNQGQSREIQRQDTAIGWGFLVAGVNLALLTLNCLYAANFARLSCGSDHF